MYSSNQTMRKSLSQESISSGVSALTINDLPNLPGIKRNPGVTNPKLYKEYKASLSRNGTIMEQEADDKSLASLFESPSKLQSFSRTLTPYPSNGEAFNDISGRYSLVSQQRDRLNKTKSLPYITTTALPAFVTNDSKVCTFLGCFTENNNEGNGETRKVEIKVFLEDNSIEVREPKVENSGTWQGKFLKRHQIFKPNNRTNSPDGRLFYGIEDFTAGAQLDIYNRVYTILDCDNHTKMVLAELGLQFGYPLAVPSTVYDPAKRSSMSRAAARTRAAPRKKQGFFEYDRKVLRFYGVWDCSNILFGDELKVRLHYSLADDLIEVLPVNTRNSGRDKLSKLLKRTKIMKQLLPIEQTSDFSHFPSFANTFSPDKSGTYLPTPGSPSTNIRGSLRSSKGMKKATTASTYSSEASILSGESTDGIVPSRPYHWKDLRIGELISVASLNVLLVDADDFTREFYNSKGTPLGPPIMMDPPVYPTLQTTIPPYNGFGSEEDSLQTCKPSLIPAVTMKDGLKAKTYQGVVLRYEASIHNPELIDKDRKFIIQVHLEDDTIQIREPTQRNSGHKGGIFLARCRLEHHNNDNSISDLKEIYVGAMVTILSHQFDVHDADAYTLKYMEANSNNYIFSDVNYVMQKVMERREALKRVILTYPSLSTAVIDLEEMINIFERSGLDLLKQEMITAFRAVDIFRTGTVKLSKMLKYIMDLE